MTENETAQMIFFACFLIVLLVSVIIIGIKPIIALRNENKSIKQLIVEITADISTITETNRTIQKMLLLTNERITTLEEGRRTIVYIADETEKIFNDYVKEYATFLNENKEISNMLYEIKRTYNSITGDIVAVGFVNIKSISNLNSIFDAKQLIASKYKKKLFYFDKTNSISGSLNLMLKAFATDILIICRNEVNGIRHNKFKILCVEFFDKIMGVIVENLTRAAIHNIVTGTDYDIAKNAILSGNIEMALRYAPESIPNIKFLAARYKLLVDKNIKTGDSPEELYKVEKQIIAAITDFSPQNL